MKFILTIVHMSRETRRQMGKARTEVIDTPAGMTPESVERTYEATWDTMHPGSASSVKVVDIRAVSTEAPRRELTEIER